MLNFDTGILIFSDQISNVISGRYTNTSDYVRDLIRKDQDTNIKIQQMQAMVTKGLESGIGSRSMEELAKVALK